MRLNFLDDPTAVGPWGFDVVTVARMVVPLVVAVVGVARMIMVVVIVMPLMVVMRLVACMIMSLVIVVPLVVGLDAMLGFCSGNWLRFSAAGGEKDGRGERGRKDDVLFCLHGFGV